MSLYSALYMLPTFKFTIHILTKFNLIIALIANEKLFRSAATQFSSLE